MDDLSVRVYADSVEDLKAACEICDSREQCEKDVFKPCMVWCG